MKLIYNFFLLLIIIILHTSKARPRIKRAIGSHNTNLWYNATIPYIVDDTFSKTDKFYLEKSIYSFQTETCLKFPKYKPNEHANWVKIENGNTCYSEVGLQNSGQQALYLSKTCRQYGLIMHELGHTVGLDHEMMRPDRNQHIRYFLENIQDEAKVGFEIDSNQYKFFNTPFDFQSIMMYSPYEFSKNGLPVWLKMNKTDQTPIFDVREKDFSFWDVKALNIMYKCGNHCVNINCNEPNFMDKNCVCQTPEAFAERRCIDNENHTEFCNNASETNICYSKPVYSSVFCRKTCGRCFQYGTNGNNKAPPYKCVDEDNILCRRNKADGYCFTDKWTKAYCKKSCNKCTNYTDPHTIEFVCKDRYDTYLCEAWAENGQCDVNPGFMKGHCAMSCGTCSSNSNIKKPETPCRNYSPDSYCDAMYKENKCDGTTLSVCLGSCGKCGTNYERNESNVTEKEVAIKHENKMKKECKDLVANCQYFSDEGYCTSQKESMKYHCSKTCNLCSQKECKNEDSEDVCDAIKERGWCSAHAGYASRCQKTCQLCEEIEEKVVIKCQDRDTLFVCQEIVRRNQCETNRNQRCQRSCNICNETHSAPTSPTILTPIVESQTPKPCVNEDSEEICEDLKNRGLCSSYLNRAVLCRQSCNLCLHTTTQIATIMETTSKCINVEDDQNCISWASTGYCEANKEYMTEKCSKTCNFCMGAVKATEPTTTIKRNEVCSNTESDESCDSWKDNYCTISHIAEMCRRTCGLCQ